MKAKRFNILHGTSLIISSIALMLSFIAGLIYGDNKYWAYLFLSTIAAALQLYSIWRVIGWSWGLGPWDDEDELEFDHSSIPYIIIIAISNIFAICLFIHALITTK